MHGKSNSGATPWKKLLLQSSVDKDKKFLVILEVICTTGLLSWLVGLEMQAY